MFVGYRSLNGGLNFKFVPFAVLPSSGAALLFEVVLDG